MSLNCYLEKAQSDFDTTTKKTIDATQVKLAALQQEINSLGVKNLRANTSGNRPATGTIFERGIR